MAENYQLAFQLLVVGMLSVFFILAIVIGLARLLIFTVNNFVKEPIDSLIPNKNYIEHKELAVLSSVVEMITSGKGSIKSIKKI